uniref:Tachykinin-like peptide-XIV n=1 Tax=Phoneutria nigriventer TaxID=6918 RepID=TLP14_PHONI|nr:RecName: Full=Tachykinin-like peptide-XIV; AltName: Full=P.nigriventer tachykinin peptides XIV; Short=PnTkP-XIV; AltName: Full=U29-ctenitoxin-Pn1n; Short=U29-CNTX-Pn1n [Phoneutria nigriventer]
QKKDKKDRFYGLF